MAWDIRKFCSIRSGLIVQFCNQDYDYYDGKNRIDFSPCILLLIHLEH